MPRRDSLLCPHVLVLLLCAGCSDYGIKGADDGTARGSDDGGSPDDGGDGGDAGVDSGYVPPDDEEGDGGSGDGGSTDIPDFTDCGDAGLWEDQWWGSMPFSHEAPLTDSSGRVYTSVDFDLTDWSTVVTPDEGHIPSGSDRVYRVQLWLDEVGPRFFLDIQSDDGVWIHVNEAEVGHWGGGWQEEGCVNDLASCTEYVEADPVEITDYLNVGSNLLAVRVSNAVNNAYMWVSPRCAEG